MTEFFLKSDAGRRVLEWISNDSGFVGRASDQDRASLPILYAKFRNELEAYGEDKAQKECRENGEWRIKHPPRSVKFLERKLEQLFTEIKALQDELAEAIKLEKGDDPVEKPKPKKKVTSKKKTSSKKTEATK